MVMTTVVMALLAQSAIFRLCGELHSTILAAENSPINSRIQGTEEHAGVHPVSERLVDAEKSQVKQEYRYLDAQC